MKNRAWISGILTVVLFTLIFTGCRQKDAEGAEGNNNETEQSAVQTDGGKEDEEPVKDQDPGQEVEGSRESEEAEDDSDNKLTNSKAERAYMKFMSGDSLTVSDIDEVNTFRKGNRYGLSEIIDDYLKEELNIEDRGKYGLKDAYYSYIDCGNDGIEELAVKLVFEFPYGDWNHVYFFRYDGGEVHLIGCDEWGYRSDIMINKYGYVVNSGSGGANIHVWDYYYFDKDGNRIFLVSEEMVYGMDTPRVPYWCIPENDRNGYPEDSYNENGYTVLYANFEEYKYEENKDFDEYYRNQIYSFTDDKENDAVPSAELQRFYKKSGIKWYTSEEYESIINEHKDKLGATKEIRDADEPRWRSLIELSILDHEVVEDKAEEEYSEPKIASYVIKDDHKKPYISKNAPSPTPFGKITLKQVSCTENDITDVDEWFSRAGCVKCGTDFSDDTYSYTLTGDAGFGTMTQINVYDKTDKTWLYSFDFGDFLYEDGYEGNSYVDRGIHNCFMVGNMLYLNMYHTTYAEDCPANGYIICVNADNGEVLWISEPLVANSNTFVRWGDNIITGYGFTAEDDYIYLLNRYSGEIAEKIKVKKSPDYFVFSGGDLWVRTYSYDYVYNIIPE